MAAAQSEADQAGRREAVDGDAVLVAVNRERDASQVARDRLGERELRGVERGAGLLDQGGRNGVAASYKVGSDSSGRDASRTLLTPASCR